MPLRTKTKTKPAESPDVKIPVEKLPVPVDVNWIEEERKLFPDPIPNPTDDDKIRIIVGGEIYDVELRYLKKLSTAHKFEGFLRAINPKYLLASEYKLERWPMAYNPDLGEYRLIKFDPSIQAVYKCIYLFRSDDKEFYTWEDVAQTGSVVLVMDLHHHIA